MDFVGALPKTVKGFDSIWVNVDRLTKSAHFVRLHGIPSSVVSNGIRGLLLSFGKVCK